MASKIDDALYFVICNGIRCGYDKCELDSEGQGCMFSRADKRFLADIARRRYEKREKTPRLQEWMQIINKAFPRSAKVV